MKIRVPLLRNFGPKMTILQIFQLLLKNYQKKKMILEQNFSQNFIKIQVISIKYNIFVTFWSNFNKKGVGDINFCCLNI